ncbi:uncharacterized protein LOC111694775 [Eurytemora carolleeae]|uniref:uncharacterized protein LOC111694775 n=1 Tax=Eurytemora carolleeae TaxID=1294199 RepID=UPI000C76F542|nr:uncharacterized protein LOC111694775 [Eurytemora carolleeae]|eukprot:XP_023319558.1 uncharacterized protein LOC111694775 [Eurytemora affinis]
MNYTRGKSYRNMKHNSQMDFPQPRSKRTRDIPGQPIPVPLTSLTGQPASNFVWKCYKGRLETGREEDANGRTSVISLEDRGELGNLWRNGYFGSIVSDRFAKVQEYTTAAWDPGTEIIQSTGQGSEKYEDWKEDDDFWTNKDEPVPEKPGFKNEEVIKPENGEENENLNPATKEPQSWDEVETKYGEENEHDVRLDLELCEAFYLSYALGCLVVEYNGSQLNLLQMWKTYSKLEPDFPYRYAVYHDLRSRGWVVRSGVPLGAHWILYKLGPPFYHASFTVRLELVCGQSGRVLKEKNITPLSWADLLGLNR